VSSESLTTSDLSDAARPIARRDSDNSKVGRDDVVSYALRLGDDALIAAQRMGEWIAAAPQLEEDVALANLALDLLGQARAFLTYAGIREGAGRDEDALAYFRDERDFLNAQIFELPNGDFGQTIARLLVTSTYQLELYQRLQHSQDDTLAAIAAKAVKEVDYHRDHATQWTLRLGDGTEESHRRMQAGLEAVWPYVGELFESDVLVSELARQGIAVDPSDLRTPALAYVESMLAEATLTGPQSSVQHTGGRRGIHTEHMGYLLAEMQYVARCHPGARW
jgi:ring-1,2-phenylacetyl-CoA epoxidase subunit PaaC